MKKLITAMAVVTAFAGQTAIASPTSLHGNTGVYKDETISWQKQAIVKPSADPEKQWTMHSRWAVFYGPQPSCKTSYIELVEETHVNKGDVENIRGSVRTSTYTIGKISGYRNGKAKLNVTYSKNYEYDSNGKTLSARHLKDRENKTYEVTVPSDQAFSLKLPDGSIQNYSYEAADIGGYDNDMTAYLKKKH